MALGDARCVTQSPANLTISLLLILLFQNLLLIHCSFSPLIVVVARSTSVEFQFSCPVLLVPNLNLPPHSPSSRSLGYGDAFTCGNSTDWKGTCQYRLLVWTSDCTVENEGPLVRGDWANLENFMKEEYKSAPSFPKLTAQIDVSSLQSVPSQDVLGANSEQTEVGFWGGCFAFGIY